ncbi:TetR/AcrR family transcriptional regulator [Thalassobacillus hwangdonensis]|uniref:TetR/AcrR family transcriptional regulator n=1 Tax=Thalassobacillus hwangdonensis TaxID=546108 RepID=A0ABW3L8A2_9BACI
MRKENKRQLLIDAAYKVFAKKGYKNASIKDIAKEAEITPGLVHYYFKSKEELLLEVQEHVQRRYQKQYEGRKPQELSMKETLNEIKSRAEEDPDWYRLRYELYGLGLKNESIQHEVRSLLKSGRDSLAIPMQQVRGKKGDEEQLASILLACFDGLALQKIMDDTFDLDEAYGVLNQLMENYLKE